MIRRFAWFLALLLGSAPVTAEIGPQTRWADPAHVKLDVEFPGDGYHATWDLYRCDCGDLLVHSELAVPGQTEKGETLLVGGRVVLSRGFGEHQDELGASLDAPALMMQLALRLLERSEPGGPSKITGVTEIDLTEKVLPINLDSGGAVGGFKAPWSVQGRLSPFDGTLRRFDLLFTFTVLTEEGPQKPSMRLVGVADFAHTPFPIAGSDTLYGWDVVWREREDPAAQKARGVKTLDELRAVLQAN